MDLKQLSQMYNLTGQTMVVTGGTGVLGSAMTGALAGCGANVVLLARTPDKAQALRDSLGEDGQRVDIVQGDVLDESSLRAAAEYAVATYGRIDGLLNGAGGNRPEATTSPDRAFFDIPPDALRAVFELNLFGAILPSQVFGKHMAQQGNGVILNVSSMSAARPMTRVLAYSGAKAAIDNFTRWLAVHMAMEYAPTIRVNAVAPGFFFTEQNRYLLTDRATGELTPRGRAILSHTPMNRFGTPDDLLGAVLWLLSPASAFVTGIVVPVDGGFSAYAGV